MDVSGVRYPLQADVQLVFMCSQRRQLSLCLLGCSVLFHVLSGIMPGTHVLFFVITATYWFPCIVWRIATCANQFL